MSLARRRSALHRDGYHRHRGAHGEADVNVCSFAVSAGQAHCLAHVRTDDAAVQAAPAPARYAEAARAAEPAATLGNGGAYDPYWLQSAYNAPSTTAGAGQTVAIVDAYDDPTAEADLAYYRNFFGLPACTTANGCFKKVDQNGGNHFPTADVGWSQEIALDLDMVSAMCRQCKILLVEASTNYMSDLGTAVNTAVRLGANVVSNSYGSGEYSGETGDSAAYFNHPGVAIVASSGDNGYGVEFPAASATVTAVGGTSLLQATNSGTRNATETAWSGAGSGCSAFVAKPAWQHDTGCPRRVVADVSAVADPNTGVWVYDTFGTSGFLIFGGTSVAAPIVGAMYALAQNPGSPDTLAAYPYTKTGSLNDVTSGSNGSCTPPYLCTAGSGYDGPTGLGTPNTSSAFTATPAVPTPPSAPQGLSASAGDTTATLNWSAPASSGGALITSYNIYRGSSPGGEATSPIATNVSVASFTDASLSNGAAYYYKVTAVNSAGEGSVSNEASATPQAPALPSAPQNLLAAAANTKVSLTWSVPSNTGGSAITYNVYRGTSPGGESASAIASGLTSATFTDVGRTNGTAYYYTVRALNATGTGPASNEASATPAGVPGAPILTAATSSARGVKLAWTAPAANGSAITQYVLYRSTASGSESTYVNVVCSASTCTYNDTNTRNGRTYYYQAAAINTVGTGSRSAEAHARAR